MISCAPLLLSYTDRLLYRSFPTLFIMSLSVYSNTTAPSTSPQSEYLTTHDTSDERNWSLWFFALRRPLEPLSQNDDYHLITRAKEYAVIYHRAVAVLGHVITTDKDYEPGHISTDGWENLLPFLPQNAFFIVYGDGSIISVVENAKKMAIFINSFPPNFRHKL